MTIEEMQIKLEKEYYDKMRKKLEDANIENVEFILSLLKNEQWNLFDLQERLCRLEDIGMCLEDCEEPPVLDTEDEIAKALRYYEDKVCDSEEWSCIISNYLIGLKEEQNK